MTEEKTMRTGLKTLLDAIRYREFWFAIGAAFVAGIVLGARA